MALLRVGGFNLGKRREELLASYEGEEPYMPGGYETPYDGEEPYMPQGYDEPYDDYGDDGYGYEDEVGYGDGYGYDDASRYDDDYGYDEAYGYDDEGYPGDDGDDRAPYYGAPYYEAPEYVPDYPDNSAGDLLSYVDEHEWINWVLLFLVPPLGIWLLWRRNRYSQNANILLTLLSLLFCATFSPMTIRAEGVRTAVMRLPLMKPMSGAEDSSILPLEFSV